MGIEGKQLNSSESPQKPVEIEYENKKVKICPQKDGTYIAYIDNCIFSVQRNGDLFEAENITPTEYQGAWRAPELQTLAIHAVTKYFPI